MNAKKSMLLAPMLAILQLFGLPAVTSTAAINLGRATALGNRAIPQLVIPQVTRAAIVKKDLIIEGENFAAGASVLLNGTKTLKARNDDAAPGTKLIVKKGRNSLPVDEVVALQVKNPDQHVSAALGFFTGLTLTFHNTIDGVTNFAQVGQIVLLDFEDPDIMWLIHDSGYGTAIEFISSNVPLMPKAQQLFLAKQPGSAYFRMEGTRLGDPSFLWLVNLDIK